MRINAFDYFRGIAILFIVAGHSINPFTVTTFAEKVLANLIMGGTALFVFISGFFFHYVFYQKFKYQTFIIKKIQYVFFPYLLLITLGFLLLAFYLDQLPFLYLFMPGKPADWQQYIQLYFQYLGTGRLFYAYWYIPFIMLIFALSPLFIKQIQLPAKTQIFLILLFFCLSAIVLRPLNNLSSIHSVIYYLPVYMLGILVSINKERVLQVLKGKTLLLGIVVLLLAILQVLIYDNFGSFHKASIFVIEHFDIIIWQKVAMCFFFMSLLDKLENKKVPVLKYVADTSFAIYFIHPWVFFLYGYYSVYQSLSFLSGPMLLMFNMVSAIVISLIIAKLLKLTFRQNSRMVIGY